MKLPGDLHLFSKKAQKYLRDCQPNDAMVPERPTQGGCSEGHHSFVSKAGGGNVAENLDRKCKCGAKTLREILGE